MKTPYRESNSLTDNHAVRAMKQHSTCGSMDSRTSEVRAGEERRGKNGRGWGRRGRGNSDAPMGEGWCYTLWDRVETKACLTALTEGWSLSEPSGLQMNFNAALCLRLMWQCGPNNHTEKSFVLTSKLLKWNAHKIKPAFFWLTDQKLI